MKPFPEDYQKKRLIICTDIGGGDPDDIQSMVHFLHYSNMFDLEGIVVGRPKGKMSAMRRVLKAYAQDYPKLAAHNSPGFEFPTARDIRLMCFEGAKPGQQTPAKGWSSTTQGSAAIVKAAKRDDARFLHVLCWGACTDLAQAVHDYPAMVKNTLAFAVGGEGYNYEFDPAPTDYLRKNKNLTWVLSDSTVRGIYMPGLNSEKKYGNVGFVKKVVRPAGAMGSLFYHISEPINVNRFGIKMGDTASLLFLFNGDFSDPSADSWAGRYAFEEFNRWGDASTNALGPYPGAGYLAKHRTDILKDWEQRLKWVY